MNFLYSLLQSSSAPFSILHHIYTINVSQEQNIILREGKIHLMSVFVHFIRFKFFLFSCALSSLTDNLYSSIWDGFSSFGAAGFLMISHYLVKIKLSLSERQAAMELDEQKNLM